MKQPIRLFAISGSLRAASSNTAVLQAMGELAPEDIRITLYEQLGELPYFNPDLDREGDVPPALVGELRTYIQRADGILISSPEYAHSLPGVLKNALDWLVSSQEFPGKAVALINISPRSIYVQASLTEILTTMSAALATDDIFTMPIPRERLTRAAMLADPQIRDALQAAIAAFVRTITQQQLQSGHP